MNCCASACSQWSPRIAATRKMLHANVFALNKLEPFEKAVRQTGQLQMLYSFVICSALLWFLQQESLRQRCILFHLCLLNSDTAGFLPSEPVYLVWPFFLLTLRLSAEHSRTTWAKRAICEFWFTRSPSLGSSP